MELDTQRYNSLVCYIKNDSLIIESNKQLLRNLLDNICGIKKVDLFGWWWQKKNLEVQGIMQKRQQNAYTKTKLTQSYVSSALQ